ncbi:MAG: amidohydrolase family protein [Thermodesulfobacteriota bacterium]
MLIDAHTHAFLPEDLEVLAQRMALLDAHLPDDDPHKWRLFGEGSLGAVAQSMARAGAQRFVLLPVAGSRERVGQLNRWAAQAAAQHAGLIPFGTLHPKGRVAADLALLLELGLKGVKLHPFIQRFSLDHPEAEALLALVEEAGLPVLVDTIHPRGLARAKPHMAQVLEFLGFSGTLPEQIAGLARTHPGLKIIAAHGGSLYGWQELEPLLDLDNVYFDLAYLNGLIETQDLMRIIRRKGPQRIIYGSDAPWREPTAFRQWFEDLPLTSGEREMISAGTVLELLGEA